MRQIRFRLGLRHGGYAPDPALESRQRSPHLSSWIIGVLLRKKRRRAWGEKEVTLLWTMDRICICIFFRCCYCVIFVFLPWSVN